MYRSSSQPVKLTVSIDCPQVKHTKKSIDLRCLHKIFHVGGQESHIDFS